MESTNSISSHIHYLGGRKPGEEYLSEVIHQATFGDTKVWADQSQGIKEDWESHHILPHMTIDSLDPNIRKYFQARGLELISNNIPGIYSFMRPGDNNMTCVCITLDKNAHLMGSVQQV